MLAVKGYFDGTTIKPLEKIIAKPNQKVIITILDDEFINFKEKEKNIARHEKLKNLCGILSEYANPDLMELENGVLQEKNMREKAIQAFFALRDEARKNGLQGMSLDEINEEINLARKEAN